MHTEISTATIRTTRRVYYVCSYLFVFFELVSYFFSYRVEKSDTKIFLRRGFKFFSFFDRPATPHPPHPKLYLPPLRLTHRVSMPAGACGPRAPSSAWVRAIATSAAAQGAPSSA